MSEYTVFIKRVGLVGAVRFIANLQGLILLPLLTKTFEASGYGVWSLIFAGVSMLMPFVMLGLPSALVRFLSSKKQKTAVAGEFFAALLAIFIVSGILSALTYLSAETLANVFFRDANAVPLIRLVSLLIILEAMNQTSRESFRTFGQIKRYSALTLLQTFIEVALVSLAVLGGFGLYGAILAMTAARALILLLSLGLIVSYCGFSPPNYTVLGQYLIFGLPLVPSTIFALVVSVSDRYLIAFFRDSAAVGVYSASYSLGCLAIFSLGPITCILSPTIFRLYDEGKTEEVKTYLAYSMKYFLMFSIPSVFGVTILAAPLLYSLTTPEFVPYSALIVPMVAASMLFEGAHAMYGEVLMLFKRTRIFGIASIVAGITNIALNILLIPVYGIVAAAATTLVAYALLGLVMYYNSRQYMRFPVDQGFIAKSVAGSIIMTAAVYAYNPIGALHVLAAVVLGMAVYFAALLLLGGFGKEEMKVFAASLGVKRP